MSCQACPKRGALQWFGRAMCVLGDRFTIRKDTVLLSTPSEEVDIFWRVVTVLLWAFCIYMRRYDIILRGCSPIALETLIPLLRVALVEHETMLKKEEPPVSSVGNNNTHRSYTTSGAIVRNIALQQRKKERIGVQTAFAVEQFAWFAIIFAVLDLTNIHRLSVALFLANTLHWIRLGPKFTSYLVGLYVLVTYFWYPAYSLRDTFLVLSGQRSWVYNMYSSYSLAFSITLLVTDTQFLQRARHMVIWKVLVAPSALENSLANTSLNKVCSLARRLPDYFFFLGFNFCMALCIWFSVMMFEWALEVSCTGIICTIFAIPVILGEGWMDNPHRALCEGILCLLSYLIVGVSVFLCVPTHSLSFMANSVSSAFFVFYMAAHSPRRVRSSLPLALVWLAMISVDAYWQSHRAEMGISHTMWYNQILCINTITFGGLFMLSTAAHVYRWEWPTESAPATTTVTSNASPRSTVTAKTEHKPREKSSQTSVQPTVEKASVVGLMAATTTMTATTAFAVTSPTGQIMSTGGEESVPPLSPSPSSSSSMLTSMLLDGVKLLRKTAAKNNTGQVHESDETLGESVCKSPVSPVERHSNSQLDADIGEDEGSCEVKPASDHTAPPTASDNAAINTTSSVVESDEAGGGSKGLKNRKAMAAKEKKRELVVVVGVEEEEDGEEEKPNPADGKGEPLSRSAASQEKLTMSPRKQEEVMMVLSSFSPSLSVSRREKREEVKLPPFVTSDSSTKTEPCLQSVLLSSSSIQTNSSTTSTVEKKSGVSKRKTPKPASGTDEETPEKGGKGDRQTSVAKTRLPTTASPENAVKKDVPIPLPRGLTTNASSLPLKGEAASATTVTKAKSLTVVGEDSQATASRTRGTTTNNNDREPDTKPTPRREATVATVQQQVAAPSLQKKTGTEAVKPKRQDLEKTTLRVNSTSTVKPPVAVSQAKASEKKRVTPDTTATMAAPVPTAGKTATRRTRETKTNGISEAPLDSAHRGNKNQQGGTSTSGSIIFNIPQPRSTMPTVAAAPPPPPAPAPPPATSAVGTEGNTTTLWQPSTSSGSLTSEVFAKTKNNTSEEMSSHGDDDVPLDFSELHLGSPTEAEPTSPRQSASALSFEASRGMPPSARHALENFAKAWMPHVDILDDDDEEHCVKTIAIKDGQASANLVQRQQTVMGQPATYQVTSSKSAGSCVPPFVDSSSTALRSSSPSPSPPLKGGENERVNQNSYLVVSPSLQHHVAAPTQIDSQLPQLTQPQAHPQVPMVMVQMSDGRVALCPVFHSGYSTVSPVVMSAPHVKTVSVPQQQPMMYSHMAFPTQQMYAPAWSHVGLHSSTPK